MQVNSLNNSSYLEVIPTYENVCMSDVGSGQRNSVIAKLFSKKLKC